MNIEEKREALRLSFDDYIMAGYSEAPSGHGHLLGEGYNFPSDPLRNINLPSSEKGLFKENHDIYFWCFGNDGAIVRETTTHFNNFGLVSRKDCSAFREGGEFRIAVLGDESPGATTSNFSWPDSLENFLNDTAGNNAAYRVLNFGHLDTGVSEWRTIWEERAKSFDVDLVIVNLSDHIFNRIGKIYSHVSHWAPVPGFRYVTYSLPGDQQAVSWIRCAGDAQTLRDPDCYTSKLLTFWLDPVVARDKALIATLRNMIITDYVEGADLEGCDDFLNPRDHAYPEIPQYSENERLDWVSRHFTWFAKNFSDVLFLMNPGRPHFQDYSLIDHSKFRNLELLAAMNPEIEVIDMRRSYKLWGNSDISGLYSPYMPEKWSNHGHRLYGEAVGEVVLEHLDGMK